MKKAIYLVIIFACLGLIAGTGCQHSGSREYIPGKGWMRN